MNEERIQKLANRLPQGDDSRHASSKELLELCHALLAPSPAQQEAFTQGDLMKSNPTFGPGRDHYGLDMASTEPVSEPYKFKVGDRVRLKGSVGVGRTITNERPGLYVEGYEWCADRVLELMPNPPETPDSWPGDELIKRCEESRAMIGRMCSEGRPPIMRIPLTERDEDQFIVRTLEACIKVLRHQITAEQLGELERESVALLKIQLQKFPEFKDGFEIAAPVIRNAFARLRAKAEGGSK